ncbi:hypothetical protein [Winogradskyella sediminis]|uniref:hypothetical protein n=1 Tax=Winogradskyella sediminis TaxID=1382466 RepID=UPI000E247C45|nr:hypothetical protein [Winogradskyella sediminis]REG90053.1 hypothetical protein C8N41_1011301 [Winogradskyella sediminis]
MKTLYISLICLLLMVSCKSDTSKTPISETVKELSITEKIANAHGFKNWKNVSEVKFTFQVDRDTIKGKGRSWTWFPKEDKIKMKTDETTVEYIRNQMDSTHVKADQAFINDKYWLLVPFQLAWDNSATISEPVIINAPISKTQLNMLTIAYPNEGGYTPGDAYDIYYDNDFIIKEWVFRKGNSKEPSLTTTFENHKDYNGIKIATDHKKADGNWNLNFTDVRITLDK